MSKTLKKYGVALGILSAVIGVMTVMHPFQLTSKTGEVVVGLQSGYPPFEFMDSEGKIVGFDIDIARYLADKLGKKLIIKDMDFDGEILSLKQGKIDLIISGMNITASREKEIFMVPYHGDTATSLALIFWGEIPEGVQSIEDLARLGDASVTVESGTIPESYLAHYPAIQTKSFQGALAPLMDVKYGKSTASLVELDVAEYLKNKHSEIQILPVPLAEEESIAGFGIGIKDEKLFQEVKKAVQELKVSGELKKIEEKWFMSKGENL